MNLPAVILKYKELFDKNKIKPIKHEDGHLSIDTKQRLEHCRWMLDQMNDILKDADNPWLYDTEAKLQKCHRWLGFLQGVMWTQSMFTIEDLKNDNRA